MDEGESSRFEVGTAVSVNLNAGVFNFLRKDSEESKEDLAHVFFLSISLKDQPYAIRA